MLAFMRTPGPSLTLFLIRKPTERPYPPDAGRRNSRLASELLRRAGGFDGASSLPFELAPCLVFAAIPVAGVIALAAPKSIIAPFTDEIVVSRTAHEPV